MPQLTGSSQDSGEGSGLGRSARVLFGVVVGFVAVAGGALLLFLAVGNARTEALRRQLSRQVGHFGGQIESVVQHYQDSSSAQAGVDTEPCSALEASRDAPRVAPDSGTACEPGDLARGALDLLRTRRQLVLSVGAQGAKQSDARECVRVSLEQLLRGAREALRAGNTVPPSFFSQLLLVDGQGDVIEALAARPAPQLGSLTGLEKSDARSSLVLEDIQIGGESYVAFVEPLQIPLVPAQAAGRASNGREQLLLAGLVPKAQLARAKLEVSPAYFLWAVLLLSVGVLALPLAKLWLMGPKAPLERSNLALLLSSAALTALLSTTLFLGFVARNRLLEQLDEATKRVATELATDVQTRIVASSQTLTRQTVSKEMPGGSPACALSLNVDLPEAPADWSILFWTNASGLQTQKWMAGKDWTPFVTLDNRPYFRRLRDGELELLTESRAQPLWGAAPPATIPDDQPWGTAEIVRSVTTGKIVLIVARPLHDDPAHGFSGLVGLESNIESLQHQLLPPGFQTAVVNRDGYVMLHSSNEAYQGQNIFDSVADPKPLRAFMETRVERSLELDYLGVASRAYVKPLTGGWSVIVFAQSSLADTCTRQVVVLSLTAFGILTFAGLFCLGLLRTAWAFRRQPVEAPGLPRAALAAAAEPPTLRLLQPNADRAWLYGRVGLFGIGTGVLVGATALLVAPYVPLSVWLAICLTAGGVAVLALIYPERLPGKFFSRPQHSSRANAQSPTRSNLARAYSACCLGMASLFICAPLAALFGSSFDALTELSARGRQEHFAHALRYHPDCWDGNCAELTPLGLEPSLRKGGTQGAAPKPTGALSADCWLDPLLCLLDALPPFEHVSAPGSGRLYGVDRALPAGASTAQRRWVRQGAELLMQDGARELVRTRLPTLFSLAYEWPGLFALCFVFGSFLTITILALHVSLERLLFLRLLSKPPQFVTRERLREQLAPHPRTFALGTPETAELFMKDSAALALTGSGLPASALTNPQTLWCVHDLKAHFLDTEFLLALERDLPRIAGSVVLFSVADFVRIPDLALRNRWARLLQAFTWVGPAEPRPTWESSAQLATMWSDCDEDERRLLGQLARRAYVTPHPDNAATLTHLAARGVLDPRTLTFATSEIAAFARAMTSAGELQRLESVHESDSWLAVRVPLTTGVAVLLLCIGVSQPELAQAGLALPGALALLPMVLRRLHILD